ncbi:SDR family oxidoreductase [Streptomyces stramineus]|uniref:SDR family oxidoreductase n=1 Tax=Streptomyces stramineus TaxID=173861 RepID=A0ABP3KUP9_9ACTN
MTQPQGRTALVTGASAGIGRDIARRLAADGVTVAVHYGRRKEAAQETVAAIEEAGGHAFTVGADLTADGAVDTLFAELEEALEGRGLDILVNNAGVSLGRDTPSDMAQDDYVAGISHVTTEVFDSLFAINARAPFFVIQRALPLMGEGGRIINISSAVTRIAWPLLAYAMSKGALEIMGSRLAQQLGPRGITVNTVAPGITDTEMNSWVHETPGAEEGISAMTALGRLGLPDDISAVVAFLASEEARWVTGQLIDASGGLCLAPGGM